MANFKKNQITDFVIRKRRTLTTTFFTNISNNICDIRPIPPKKSNYRICRKEEKNSKPPLSLPISQIISATSDPFPLIMSHIHYSIHEYQSMMATKQNKSNQITDFVVRKRRTLNHIFLYQYLK